MRCAAALPAVVRELDRWRRCGGGPGIIVTRYTPNVLVINAHFCG
jgi:hypothetical protein